MKPFYLSKLVWLGIVQTLLGALTVIADFMQSGKAFDPLGIVLIVSGILTVVLRIWFTNVPIDGGQPPVQ
jgi:hypothetical protein